MIARTFEERRQAQQIRIFRHVPRLTPAISDCSLSPHCDGNRGGLILSEDKGRESLERPRAALL